MPPAIFNPYPFATGPKMYGMIAHPGPASYTQVASGGDVVNAVAFGMKNVERVSAGLTSDHLYQVQAINSTTGPKPSVVLKWIVVATGLEVGASVNLSGSSVNLDAIGL